MKGKTNRLGVLTVVILFAVCSLNCISTTSPVVYTDNPKKDFIILGEVTYESNMYIPEIQKNGYTALLAAAKRKYPNCDYVIDIMVDHKKTLVFFVYPFDNYVMRGTAIQYIRNNSEKNTETGFSIRSVSQAPDSVAENYTVADVTGRVQIQRFSGDSWHDVKESDVLNKEFRLRTASNSSLTLFDGEMTTVIPGNIEGRINSLIEMLIK